MPRKALPFAFVLALIAAGCAAPQHAEVEFGSGTRFVPMVADSLNDAGHHVQVAIDQEGRPLVAYFAFEEETAEGVLPQTRPVGAPSIPGVLMATLNEDGIWTRGAIALQGQITGVDVPFNPAFDPVIADLAAENVTGLDIAVDGDRFHAVWGSDAGAYYATGSTDPSTTEQVQMERVTDTPPYGVSIGVVGSTPWISYYTSVSESSSVDVATPSDGAWRVDAIAEAAGCGTCRTAVIAAEGGATVAYSDAGGGVSVATNDGENGWVSFGIAGGGGEGLSGVATSDGFELSYYADGNVVVATGDVGSSEADSVATVSEGSATEPGSATSIAVDDEDITWVAWVDATNGVRFASSRGEGFEPIDTGADTATGAMPSVAVTPDGTTAYLAWYDTQHEDVLLGSYGEIEGLSLAEPSPEPTPEPAAPAPQPEGDCTPVTDGVLEITAQGLEFDTGCVEAPAGEPFTISFTNEDPDQHNVAIYPSADELTDPLFRGDIIGGPDTVEYSVDGLDAGEYYFQCDVHPTTMNGTVVVDGGGGGGGGTGGNAGGGGQGGDGGQEAVTVTAQNIAFDTDTIDLPADTEGTITLVNEDTVPHNIAIYTDDTVAENLFRGDTVTGDTIDYTVPPLDAGEYYFQCDVHPTMNGSVVVG
jgi:plastocyanin